MIAPGNNAELLLHGGLCGAGSYKRVVECAALVECNFSFVAFNHAAQFRAHGCFDFFSTCGAIDVGQQRVDVLTVTSNQVSLDALVVLVNKRSCCGCSLTVFS